MTDTEITSLAREYAEGVYKDIEDERIRKPMVDSLVKGTEDSFRFLFRRYCLVEKNVIKETWEAIANLYLAEKHIDYNGARYLFNEVLFPDLGKELEG